MRLSEPLHRKTSVMIVLAVAGGHSKIASGVSAILDEYVEDRRVASALLSELARRGYATADCSNEAATVAAELAREVNAANASGADLFCAIHFNSFKNTNEPMGVETWHYVGSNKGEEVAVSVSAKLATLMNLPNRGAKATTGLYVIRKTTMPAVLVEVCFADSSADAAAYQAVGPVKVAFAIADGIDAALGEISAPHVTHPLDGSLENANFTGGIYRCNVGALNVRDHPSLSGIVVASYSRGETVVLDNWYTVADGYVWGRYTGHSGSTRYIAVGPHTGKAEMNDYLIKVKESQP